MAMFFARSGSKMTQRAPHFRTSGWQIVPVADVCTTMVYHHQEGFAAVHEVEAATLVTCEKLRTGVTGGLTIVDSKVGVHGGVTDILSILLLAGDVLQVVQAHGIGSITPC